MRTVTPRRASASAVNRPTGPAPAIRTSGGLSPNMGTASSFRRPEYTTDFRRSIVQLRDFFHLRAEAVFAGRFLTILRALQQLRRVNKSRASGAHGPKFHRAPRAFLP